MRNHSLDKLPKTVLGNECRRLERMQVLHDSDIMNSCVAYRIPTLMLDMYCTGLALKLFTEELKHETK